MSRARPIRYVGIERNRASVCVSVDACAPSDKPAFALHVEAKAVGSAKRQDEGALRLTARIHMYVEKSKPIANGDC